MASRLVVGFSSILLLMQALGFRDELFFMASNFLCSWDGWTPASSKIQQSSLFPLEGHSWRIHHCVSVIRHLHGARLTTLRVVAVVATWSYDWWVLGTKRRIVCAKVVGYLTPAGSSSIDLWAWGGCFKVTKPSHQFSDDIFIWDATLLSCLDFGCSCSFLLLCLAHLGA